MARTRHRHGLARYRPRTAATVAGEGKRARSRKLARPRRPRRLPGPRTAAARRLWTWALGPAASWPAEARALKADALAESLGQRGHEGALALWNEYLDENYRRRYREQQAGRPKRLAKPATWIKVRAHKRHRPGAHR